MYGFLTNKESCFNLPYVLILSWTNPIPCPIHILLKIQFNSHLLEVFEERLFLGVCLFFCLLVG